MLSYLSVHHQDFESSIEDLIVKNDMEVIPNTQSLEYSDFPGSILSMYVDICGTPGHPDAICLGCIFDKEGLTSLTSYYIRPLNRLFSFYLYQRE